MQFSRCKSVMGWLLKTVSVLVALSVPGGTMTHYLLEIKGFEPLTPCLQGRCSPN